jgi:hypothetical protein
MPLFYITLFVCTVNNANTPRFDHKPRRERPVQGSRPEGIRYPFAPSSRKVASGQSSHQYPQIRIARPHPIHTAFRHFFTLTFRCFLTLQLGTQVDINPPSFVRPLPGSPTQNRNLQAGHSPLPQRAALVVPRYIASHRSYRFPGVVVMICTLYPILRALGFKPERSVFADIFVFFLSTVQALASAQFQNIVRISSKTRKITKIKLFLDLDMPSGKRRAICGEHCSPSNKYVSKHPPTTDSDRRVA